MPQPRAAQREAQGSSNGDDAAAAAATCIQVLESSLLQLEAAVGGAKAAIQQASGQAGPDEPSSSAAGDVTPRCKPRQTEEALPSTAPPLETPVKTLKFSPAAALDHSDCAMGAAASGGDDGKHRGGGPAPAAALGAHGPPAVGEPTSQRAASEQHPSPPRWALRADAAEFVPEVAATLGAAETAPPPAAGPPARGCEAGKLAETIWANGDAAGTPEGQRLNSMPRLPAFPPAPPPAPAFITGAAAYLLQHGVNFLQIPPVMLAVPPVVERPESRGAPGSPGLAEAAWAQPASGAPQPTVGGPPAAQQALRRGIRNRPLDQPAGAPPPRPARPERARSAVPSQRPAAETTAAAAAPSGPAAASTPAQDIAVPAAEATARARVDVAQAEDGPTAVPTPEWMPLVLLSCLLDHFFEPFAVQQNAQLHGIIAAQLRNLGVNSPWTPEALRSVTFGAQELACLDGRVAAILEQLPQGGASQLGELVSPKRLRWLGGGRWGLRDPPEVRCLVEVPRCPPAEVGGFIRVLSHAVDGPLTDASDAGRRRRQRLDAELRAHRVDVACLQGLDPEEEGGRGVAAAFFGWGYCGYFASGDRGEDTAATTGGHAERVAALAAEALGAAPSGTRLPQASAIFWDECRWHAVAKNSSGGGVAVDLLPKDVAEGPIVRVVCIRPALADCCGEGPRSLLRMAARSQCPAVPPTVVCADLAAVGGAAAAKLVPGLDGMRSAMAEVTGAELCAPTPGRVLRGGRRELWHPGCLLVKGMRASAVLSGHSESYLAELSDADVDEHFPAGRPPLLAELRWEEESRNAWQ